MATNTFNRRQTKRLDHLTADRTYQNDYAMIRETLWDQHDRITELERRSPWKALRDWWKLRNTPRLTRQQPEVALKVNVEKPGSPE